MTDEQVAEIAAGLSDRMRGALTWPKEPRLVVATLWSQTIAGIERRGLSDRAHNLTPLGLRVRALLLSEKNDGLG